MQLTKFREEDDEFVYKVAEMPSEVQERIESGFEYICDMEDIKFFKERKCRGFIPKVHCCAEDLT